MNDLMDAPSIPRQPFCDPNPSGLCMCGCGEPVGLVQGTDLRRGWVRGHHLRYVLGHSRKRYLQCGDSKQVHRVVYEEHFGAIPDGFDVHHIDGDQLNNSPDNLTALSHGDHMKVHAGWEKRDGEWWSPCSRCGEWKPATDYYKRLSGAGKGCRIPMCKPCSSLTSIEYSIAHPRRIGGGHICPTCGLDFAKTNALAVHVKYRHEEAIR